MALAKLESQRVRLHHLSGVEFHLVSVRVPVHRLSDQPRPSSRGIGAFTEARGSFKKELTVMREDFSLSLDHHADRSIICCSGILDLLPAEHLRHAVRSAVERPASKVVVDCSSVSLLTSAGITALVASAMACKEAGIHLDLRFSSHVRRILDLVGLWWLGVIDDGVSIHTSLQGALRAYAALGSQAAAAMLDGDATGDTEDDLDGMTRGTDR